MYLQPFDKHPADPGALRQTAAELRDLAAEALELAAATRAAYQPAIDNWHGMGAAEMAAAGEPVQRDAKVESLALRWSADVTDYWAVQVDGFNRQVDVITGGLASQAADDYGATGTDGTPPTGAQVADARGAATAAAKQQWMQAYDTYIDTGRHRAAAMLARGPTEQNLAELREAGVLPAERAPAGPQGKPDDEPGLASKIGHGVLDVAGLIPVVGEPADAANAAWYAAEGDYTSAALSGAAMVPFLGWGATGAKVGIKGVKAVKGADDAVTYGRPSRFRSGVRDQVWNNATQQSTGRVRDPATGQFMSKDKPWDMGHRRGYEFRKHQQSAADRGISREQFVDEHNNPSHYRPELPNSNRHHGGEDKTDAYFGP